MKNFLFVFSCLLLCSLFIGCQEEALELSPEQESEVVEARASFFKRIKVRIRHHGVPDPENPESCGNSGTCECPLGLCIYFTPKSVSKSYVPTAAEAKRDIGVVDVYFLSDKQLKLQFVQETALPNGTIPLPDGYDIPFVRDPDLGTVTYRVLPKTYKVDFSDSEFGYITVPVRKVK